MTPMLLLCRFFFGGNSSTLLTFSTGCLLEWASLRKRKESGSTSTSYILIRHQRIESRYCQDTFGSRSFLDNTLCTQTLQALLPEAHSIQANSPMCVGMQEQFDSFQDSVGFRMRRSFQGL